MKKSIRVALVMAFMTLMASVCCFADVTFVTDTSKEGSLLIYPYVRTDGTNETYIVITHSTGETSPDDDPVSIKCYWEVRDFPYTEGTSCELSDAGFPLSIHNPTIFKASDGLGLNGESVAVGIGTGKKGILKCWVVDPTESNQIAWNHMSGYAIIVNSATAPTSAWKYSAWRFAANIVADLNGTTFGEGFWVGKTEEAGFSHNYMKLWGATAVITSTSADPAVARNSCPYPPSMTAIKVKQTFTAPTTYTYYCIPYDPGVCAYPYDDQTACYKANGVYDACPTYLSFDFFAEGTYAVNELAVAPCKEDLRSDSEDIHGGVDFPTRLVFDVWNENEIKYTGTQACIHCNGSQGSAYQLPLSTLSKGSVNYFNETYLHTSSGRFRVQGLAGGKCKVYNQDGSLNSYLSAKKTPLVGVMATQLIGGLGGVTSTDLVGTGATASGPAVVSDTLTNPGYIRWDPAGVDWKKKR